MRSRSAERSPFRIPEGPRCCRTRSWGSAHTEVWSWRNGRPSGGCWPCCLRQQLSHRRRLRRPRSGQPTSTRIEQEFIERHDRLCGGGLPARRGHVPSHSRSRPEVAARSPRTRPHAVHGKEGRAGGLPVSSRSGRSIRPHWSHATSSASARRSGHADRGGSISTSVLAPDSNINSATDKESIDIYGLPFQLDPSARARSGTGLFFGGDASLRLNRFGQGPDLPRRLRPLARLSRPSLRR